MADLIIKPSSGGSLKLQEDGGTDALTIDASGNTTLAGTANNLGTVTAGTIGSAVTGGAGITPQIDCELWRMTTSFSGGADPVVNWARQTAMIPQGGTGLTYASGVFTFPALGYWLINWDISWYSTSGATTYVEANPWLKTDGSTYVNQSYARGSMYGTGATSTSHTSFLHDCTNTNQTFKFVVGSGQTCIGNATINRTWMTAMYIGVT